MRSTILVAGLMLGTSIVSVTSPYSNLLPGGVPGIDYKVGRDPARNLSNSLTKAVYENNYYRNVSTDTVTVLSSMKGASVTLTIDPAVFPYDFRLNAVVTFVATDTIGLTPFGYLNGLVTAWNRATRQVTFKLPSGNFGHGSGPQNNGGAGGLKGFGSGIGGSGAAGQYSRWSLTLHLPSNWGAFADRRQVVVGGGITADPNDTIHTDWDFSDLCCYFTGGTGVNPITVQHCVFDQQTPGNPTLPYFSAPVSAPAKFTHNTLKVNFRRFAVTAKAVADAAPLSTTITLDAIPTKALYPGATAGTPIDKNYMCINVTDPSSMIGCLIKSIATDGSNVVTLMAQTEFDSTAKPIVGTRGVKVGDQLMFVPANTLTGTFVGPFTEISYNEIDGLADVFSGIAQYDGLYTKVQFNKINVVPMSGLHVDLYQKYGLAGDGFGLSFNWVNFGFWDEEPIYSSKLNFGGMNYCMIGDTSNPWLGDFIYSYNVFCAAPGSQVILPLRHGDYTGSRIIGIRPNAAGKARLNIDYQGNGITTPPKAIYIVKGTGTALDGPAKLASTFTTQTIYGGAALATFNTTAAAATGTSVLSVSAASGTLTSIGNAVMLGKSKTILGFVSDISQDKTQLTLDAPLTVDLASGAQISLAPYIDLDAPFAANATLGGTYTGTVANNSEKMTMASTAGLAPGMTLSGSGTDYNNLNIKSVDSSTQITLTGPVPNGKTNSPFVFSAVAKTVKVGVTKFHDNYFRFPQLNANNIFYNFVYIRSASAASVYNLFDLETRKQFSFNWVRFDGKVVGTASNGALSDYAPLPAPADLTLTALGNGQVRLDFPTVDGAQGYAYSLDGGATFAFSKFAFTQSASGQIVPGSVVTLPTGSISIVVAAFNAPNELGIPLNSGAISPARVVTVT